MMLQYTVFTQIPDAVLAGGELLMIVNCSFCHMLATYDYPDHCHFSQ